MADKLDLCPLHECVFAGDVKKLSGLLRTHDVGQKDKHGNTALHLAVMLGRKDCVMLLLAHAAPVKVKNVAGWSPLAEAISYGDRETITSLLRKLKQQSRDQMEGRRPNLVEALRRIGDFYMELKWDFQSWVPFLSRILPSDVCRISKRGASIRVDTTLVDFTDMRWEQGDVSFLFDGDCKPAQALTVLDNKACLYQRVRHEETEMEIEDEVDILMSSDVVAAQMSTKSITFTRAQAGWIFREDKKEMVGAFNSEFYAINGMVLESRKRREHLSDDDLRKNKAIVESFTRGGSSGSNGPNTLDVNGEPMRRKSLPPPPDCRVTWEEYNTASAGNHPCLGRPTICKESSKSFKATVAMVYVEPFNAAGSGLILPLGNFSVVTDHCLGAVLCGEHFKCSTPHIGQDIKSMDFPLSVDMLLNVLEVIAPFKHFSKLREFVEMKLPPGFPVKIDIPILPTVTAKITFQEFAFRSDISPELFQIPRHYIEDPMRFPDL